MTFYFPRVPITALIVASLSVALCAPAFAGTPPAATAYAAVFDRSSNASQVTSHSPGTLSQLGSVATIDIGWTPSVYAATDSVYGFASTTLTYYFGVYGPGATPVPLHAAYFGKITGTIGANVANANWSLKISNPSSSAASVYSTGTPTNYQESGVLNFTAAPGDITKIVMQANSGSIDSNTVSASAYLDPYITIDQDFATANPGYSLGFSSGVGDAPRSSVPEPATWALMLTGLTGAGATLRSRRRVMPS